MTISKLPPWIWTGAWALSFLAGIINVVGLLGFERQAVSHLTGTTSLLAKSAATLDGPAALHFLLVIGSFLLGAVFSGWLVRDATLLLDRRYGVALCVESVLLFAAVPLSAWEHPAGVYLAACACGLQNAMVSTYSGAVVRTTHVSGMFTDLGIFLGQAMRGVPVDGRRVRLSVLVISGFFCGGVVGTWAYRAVGPHALFIPGGITAMAASAFGLHALRRSSRS